MLQEWPQADIVNNIIDAIFRYIEPILKQSDLMRQRGQPGRLKNALTKALGRALKQFKEHFEEKYPGQLADLFNIDFFEQKGVPILAQFLVPGGHPDPSMLAVHWADWLNGSHPEPHPHILTREMERPAADFLGHLSDALQEELQKDARLRELKESQELIFQQLARDISTFRESLDMKRATPGTRRDYLHWAIEYNSSLDPQDIAQRENQEQVQRKLEDIYVPLRVQRKEIASSIDMVRQKQKLAELEARINSSDLTDEEAEKEHEQLLAQLVSETIEVTEALNRHDRLVILGDPGSGKTTLLRYLALRHAKALYYSQNNGGTYISPVCFPILLRIADYAEHGLPKRIRLSDFLIDYCSTHGCPEEGLDDLLAKELNVGNCLILFDGLDEIANAANRQGVAVQVEEFVRQYQNHPNRFIITSRSTGYRSVALDGSFTHYTIQEMDEIQIRDLEERWRRTNLPAQSQARPTSTAELGDAMQRLPIPPRQFMSAAQRSGARRLAANPLLLRTTLLITVDSPQQLAGYLPQKRIELYKRATDLLTQIWRKAPVAASAHFFDKDWYLTVLLSKMAYWLHDNKPTGIATEQEVYQILGAEWAHLHDKVWNNDQPNPEIYEEVTKFLKIVRESTGIFVERPPEGFGFVHLTFQEYYAARYLIALSQRRAQMIRAHLHNPRWGEPILLALGFVGLESPHEANWLLETAILARGSDAEALGFTPSPQEKLLARDYLFAVRCLGDDIPASPKHTRKLLHRLVVELLDPPDPDDPTDPTRFERYRQALRERLTYLREGNETSLMFSELLDALNDDRSDDEIRCRAAESLGELGYASPEVVEALLNALQHDSLCGAAAKGLGKLRYVSPKVITDLLNALHKRFPPVRNTIAEALKQLSRVSPQIVKELLQKDLQQRFSLASSIIAEILRQSGHTSPEMKRVLISGLSDPQLVRGSPAEVINARITAVKSLGKLGQTSPEVPTELLKVLQDANARVSAAAARSLGELRRPSPEVIKGLICALESGKYPLSEEAARSLGKLHQASPDVVRALRNALKDERLSLREAAARGLGELGLTSAEVVTALTGVLDSPTPDAPTVREAAVKSLAKLGHPSLEVVKGLITALSDREWYIRAEAVRSLGKLGRAYPQVVRKLIIALYDDSQDVRAAAAENLERLGQVFSKDRTRPLGLQSDDTPNIIQELRKAMHDSEIYDEPLVRLVAAKSLIKLGSIDSEVLAMVRKGLHHPQSDFCRRSALLLGQAGESDETTIHNLWYGLFDPSHSVRSACAQALAQLGRRFPPASEWITRLLVQAIQDPDFDAHDDVNRSAHDYAYDALWMLIVGGVFEEV